MVTLLLILLNKVYMRYYHEQYKILEDGERQVVPPRTAPAGDNSAPNVVDDLPTYEEATKTSVSLNTNNLTASYSNPTFGLSIHDRI